MRDQRAPPVDPGFMFGVWCLVLSVGSDGVGHLELLAQFSHRSQQQPLHLQSWGLGLVRESLYTEGGSVVDERVAQRVDEQLDGSWRESLYTEGG